MKRIQEKTVEIFERYTTMLRKISALICVFASLSCRPQHIYTADDPNPETVRRTKGIQDPQNSGTQKACIPVQPFAFSLAVSPDITAVQMQPCEAKVPSGKPVAMDSLSPNYGSRNTEITGIILHNTQGAYVGALDTLKKVNGRHSVSAHVLVSRAGTVTRLVGDKFRAFHAMEANSSTLGMEIEAWDAAPGMTPAQEALVLQQMKYWMAQYKITLDHVKAHREVVNSDCPSAIWPTQTLFQNWKSNIVW